MAAMLRAACLAALVGASAAAIMTPVGTSAGSCYDSTTHVVTCFQEQEACEAVQTNYFYATGYTSGMGDQCCHCYTGCEAENAYACAANGNLRDVFADYVSVSNVIPHSKMTLDVGDFETAINEAKYDEATTVYAEGKNSAKGSGMRTLKGMAVKDLTGEPMYDNGMALWGSPTFLDDFMMSVLDGTGLFEGASDEMRDQGADKTAQCILTVYAGHEFLSGISKAKAGDQTDAKSGHAWDEGVAFWYGTHNGEGKDSVWEVQGKRDKDFGTDFQGVAMKAMIDGLAGMRTGGDISVSEGAYDDIEAAWGMTFIQAGLKYGYKWAQDASAVADAVEGYAYWRCGAPVMYGVNAEATKAIDDAWKASMSKHDPDIFCTIWAETEKIIASAGAKMADLGTYDEGFKAITCDTAPAETPATTPSTPASTPAATPAAGGAAEGDADSAAFAASAVLAAVGAAALL